MEEKIRLARIIHAFLCGGLVLAYILLGDTSSLEFWKSDPIDESIYLVLGIIVIAPFLGNFLYKMKLNEAYKNNSLEDNFPHYQTACIVRWAILEGASFAIIFLAPKFILLGVLIILYMLYLRPSEHQMKEDLVSL